MQDFSHQQYVSSEPQERIEEQYLKPIFDSRFHLEQANSLVIPFIPYHFGPSNSSGFLGGGFQVQQGESGTSSHPVIGTFLDPKWLRRLIEQGKHQKSPFNVAFTAIEPLLT